MKINETAHVKIVSLSKRSAWYSERKVIVGSTGTLEVDAVKGNGWYSGAFTADESDAVRNIAPDLEFYFFRVRAKVI